MPDLRSTSIAIGAGTPAPLSKYGSAKRPAVPADATPRDGGGMSTGETSGNFKPSGMTSIGVNAGATGPQSGADAAIAAQQASGK
jgi:hypothetical protein